MVLSNASMLCDRYSVQSVLGAADPLDITYLAWDAKANHDVVIREYYPLKLARRSEDRKTLEILDAKLFEFGLSIFIREAELLKEFKHPNVSKTLHFFQENGTLYRVSNLVSGVSLASFMQHRGTELTDNGALSILGPILEGLKSAHKRHLYHGALSPKSIFIQDNGTPMLLNFQMARTRLAHYCGNVNSLLSPGFYPAEEPSAEGFASWDIYSCAALLFYLLTGKALPNMTTNAEHFYIRQAIKQNNLLSPDTRRLLLNSLAPNPADRPASIAEFQAQFHEAIVASMQTVENTSFNPQPQKTSPPSPATHGQEQRAPSREMTVPYDRFPQPSQTKPAYSSPNGVSNTQLQTQQAQTPQHAQSIPPQYYQPPPLQYHNNAPEINSELIKMVKRQQQLSLAIALVLMMVVAIAGGAYLGRPFLQDQFSRLAVATPVNEIPPAGILDNRTRVIPPMSPSLMSQPGLPPSTPSLNLLPVSPEQEPAVSTPPPKRQTPTPVRTATPPARSNDAEQPSRQAVTQPTANTRTVPSVEPEAAKPEQEPNVQEPSAEQKALRKEQQYYLAIAGGDSLFEGGQTREAIEQYEAALSLKPDAKLESRLQALRTLLAEEERQAAVAESLRVRLELVTDESGVFVVPDAPAELLNDTELSNAVKYPRRARRARIEGRVIVRMIVTETGAVEDPQVVKGIGYGCDEEVLRVLTQARYKPALFNGEAVRAWQMYSIVFNLD